MKRRLAKTKVELKPLLLDELWPTILSYLTVWQRLQYATVCKTWISERGIIDQSVERFEPRDPQILDLTRFVNLTFLQSGDFCLISAAIRNNGFQKLHSLKITKQSQKDQDLSCLRVLSNLTSLEIESVKKINYLPFLSYLTALNQLKLTHPNCHYIREDNQLPLATLTSLTDLSLCGTDIGEKCLLECTTLKHLTLVCNDYITGDCVSKLTQLLSLSVSKVECRRQDPKKNMFLCLTNLRHLKFRESVKQNISLNDVTHLTALDSLDIRIPHYAESILTYFNHLTQLTIYYFLDEEDDDEHDDYECHEIGENLATLTSLKSLKLNLASSFYINPLILKTLTNLTSLHIINPATVEVSMSFVALTPLTDLKLIGHYELKAHHLPSSLCRLDLQDSYRWTHLMPTISTSLQNLREFILGHTNTREALQESLKNISQLRNLDRIYFPYHEIYMQEYRVLVPAHVQLIKS